MNLPIFICRICYSKIVDTVEGFYLDKGSLFFLVLLHRINADVYASRSTVCAETSGTRGSKMSQSIIPYTRLTYPMCYRTYLHI